MQQISRRFQAGKCSQKVSLSWLIKHLTAWNHFTAFKGFQAGMLPSRQVCPNREAFLSLVKFPRMKRSTVGKFFSAYFSVWNCFLAENNFPVGKCFPSMKRFLFGKCFLAVKHFRVGELFPVRKCFPVGKTRINMKSLHNLNLIYFSCTSLLLSFTKKIGGKMKKFTQI